MKVESQGHLRAILVSALGMQVLPVIVVFLLQIPLLQSGYSAPIAILALPPMSLGLVFLLVTQVFYRRVSKEMVLQWLVLAAGLAGAYMATEEFFDAALWSLAGFQAAPSAPVWEIETFVPRVLAAMLIAFLVLRALPNRGACGQAGGHWQRLLPLVIISGGFLVTSAASYPLLARLAGLGGQPDGLNQAVAQARFKEGLFHGLTFVLVLLSVLVGILFLRTKAGSGARVFSMSCLGAWVTMVCYFQRFRVFAPGSGYGNVPFAAAVAIIAACVAIWYGAGFVGRRVRETNTSNKCCRPAP